MKKVIILVWVLWFISLKIVGLNLASLAGLTTTVMFSGILTRYYTKIETLAVLEGVFTFMNICIAFMLKRFTVTLWVMYVLVRVLFLLVVLYEQKNHTYTVKIVKETKRC